MISSIIFPIILMCVVVRAASHRPHLLPAVHQEASINHSFACAFSTLASSLERPQMCLRKAV